MGRAAQTNDLFRVFNTKRVHLQSPDRCVGDIRFSVLGPRSISDTENIHKAFVMAVPASLCILNDLSFVLGVRNRWDRKQ